MALTKAMNPGDELVLSFGGEKISIILSEKTGRRAVLKIKAPASVGILTVEENKIWVGAVP